MTEVERACSPRLWCASPPPIRATPRTPAIACTRPSATRPSLRRALRPRPQRPPTDADLTPPAGLMGWSPPCTTNGRLRRLNTTRTHPPCIKTHVGSRRPPGAWDRRPPHSGRSGCPRIATAHQHRRLETNRTLPRRRLYPLPPATRGPRLHATSPRPPRFEKCSTKPETRPLSTPLLKTPPGWSLSGSRQQSRRKRPPVPGVASTKATAAIPTRPPAATPEQPQSRPHQHPFAGTRPHQQPISAPLRPGGATP